MPQECRLKMLLLLLLLLLLLPMLPLVEWQQAKAKVNAANRNVIININNSGYISGVNC